MPEIQGAWRDAINAILGCAAPAGSGHSQSVALPHLGELADSSSLVRAQSTPPKRRHAHRRPGFPRRLPRGDSDHDFPAFQGAAIAVAPPNDEGAVANLNAVALAAVEHHEVTRAKQNIRGKGRDHARLEIDVARPRLDALELVHERADAGASLDGSYRVGQSAASNVVFGDWLITISPRMWTRKP